MKIHQLRLLNELANQGTITAVADLHGFTPSAVSQQLSALESEVGMQLLQAAGRKVQLTHAGEILVKHAQSIIRQVELAESELAESKNVIGGKLKIATFQTATMALLPKVLDLLKRTAPELKLMVREISPDYALSALISQDFDVVLVEEFPGIKLPDSKNLNLELIGQEELFIAFNKNVFGPASNLSDFADAPWVMEPLGNAARTWALSQCRSAGFEPDVRFEFSDPVIHQRLVETGQAVAFIPKLLFGVFNSRIETISMPTNAKRAIYSATRNDSANRPAIQIFRKTIKESYSRIN